MTIDERLRIAVDIGGTFTDCVIVGDRGTRLNTKALTTSDDPVRGVFDCLALASDRLAMSLWEILAATHTFVHGTTVGTNALVERRGARTGLLMTKGHEETFQIGRVRQKVAGLSEREKTHITHLSKAEPPIIDPFDVRGIVERIDARGQVVAALDLAQAERAVAELVEQGVESVAICLLWSFVNDAHERALRDLLIERHPKLYVATSSEVAPVLGEYERSVATVLNAYLGRLVSGYLDRLEARLRESGLPGSLLVMQANGGVTSVEGIRGRPLLTVDSGPAGGVLGARHHALALDQQNIICADVGGTTFDVGLVFAGRVQVDRVPVVDKYEYAMPKVSVRSIGAGGGSIAWLDQAGSLRVGPHSAGADPGPACYGRGGTQPTVTDAHMVLGYLHEDYPLGGHVPLDKAAAERAIATIAEPLNLTVPAVAAAIAAISNAQMADLVRRATVERGLDPREFLIFGYGGAGPVFAAFLAQQLGSTLAYVPAESGVFSAYGMLTSDLLVEEQRSVQLRLPATAEQSSSVDDIFRTLEGRVRQRLHTAGFDDDALILSRTCDLRMSMQVHELEIPIAANHAVDETALRKVTDDFVAEYERTYGAGSAYVEGGVEIAKLRVTGVIPLPHPDPSSAQNKRGVALAVAHRPAMFSSQAGYVDTAIHLGTDLEPGQHLVGPAIVQRAADTVLIPSGATADVDAHSGILIRWEEEQS